MRILIVSQYFWPENFRINDLCAELADRGHEVTVLTGKPNYPDGEVFIEYRENKPNFMHYKGCEIIRVPMIARGKGSSLQLVSNYLSYVFSASLWGAWRLRRKQFDVIFVYEPSPVTVCLPAIFIKKIKKAPVVFWVLDLWPETLEAIGVVKSPKILGWVGRLVRFIYNRCDLVLGQSKAFYTGISRYCDDTNKIKYFPSWSETVFSEKGISPIEEIVRHKSAFKILFAGNVGEAQDFPSILNAAEIIKSKKINAIFFIVGDGRAFDWVQSEVLSRGLEEYVTLLGRHPLESMPSFYACADALLVTLKDSPAFKMTIPGKVQSYMMAGKPILTMLSGEGSRVIDEAKCGYIANSGDFEQLACNVEKMISLDRGELRALGENAKRYADNEFDRDKLITQLEDWFIELSGQSKEKGL
ncbi:glycosyltransferase family 4 protein [Thiomicrorhabdus sp.]|uniref:glycosyltransferase family 4 protein n=1 Tax=Thiomicrorhabdus sp. TaxID=2039724 RepID=UPI003567BD4C